MRLKVFCVKCKKCDDTIYSRAVHDMRACSCGETFIDGGFEYIKVGGLAGPVFDMELEEGVTKTTLWKDWNYERDHYGLIKGKYSENNPNG